ncbi:XRE family transcriptional regulator [Rhodococcus qingshengii BKS 20-40]|nr:XRE family transcriptional regulator [Rhodococcus qingshengii BKS 20-40]
MNGSSARQLMSQMLVEKRNSLAPEKVGMRCEGARRMHGLSRRDVAQIADISSITISGWNRVRPLVFRLRSS